MNKQDKKKFKNMDVTGTVNCQCGHVFIKSTVDLLYGERYVFFSHLTSYVQYCSFNNISGSQVLTLPSPEDFVNDLQEPKTPFFVRRKTTWIMSNHTTAHASTR